MNTLAPKFQVLVARYQARGLDNGDGLLPPADIKAIADTEGHLGFRFPDSLQSVYALFGGQEYICPGVTGLFGRHRLLSLSEVAKDYLMYQEAEQSADADLPPSDSLPGENWERWHPALIPFAGWDAYSLVMCRYTQKIWEFEPYQGLSRQNFQNIDQLLDAVLEAATTMDEPFLDFIGTELPEA